MSKLLMYVITILLVYSINIFFNNANDEKEHTVKSSNTTKNKELYIPRVIPEKYNGI